MDVFRKRLAALRTESPVVTEALLFADLDRQQYNELRHTWPSLPLETRRQLVTAMCTVAEDHVEHHFGRALRVTMHDEDAAIRVQSIEGLWEDGGEDLLRYLVDDAMHDRADEVRVAAVRALARFSTLAAEGRLSDNWRDRLRNCLLDQLQAADNDEIRRRALEAAAAFPEDAVVRDAITRAYESDDAAFRMSALYGMSQNLDPRWLPMVRDALNSPHDGIRYEATRAAGAFGHRGTAPRLTELLGDPDREVQLAAIQSLGQIGGAGPVNVLKRLAVSRDNAVREAAEEALEEAAFMTNPAIPARQLARDDEG